MPATVKPNLKPEARADKTHAVRIRITAARTSKYHNTGIYVPVNQWNPKATYEKENWVKGHRESGLYNATIKALIDTFIDLALKHPFEDAEGLLRIYHRPAPVAVDFLLFFKRELDRIAKAGNPRTVVRRTPLYNKLYEYCGGTVTPGKRGIPAVYSGSASLPIERLTVAFVRDFITYLQTKHNNTGETIKKEMQVLSGLCKIAVQEGIMEYGQNPFPHIQVKSKPKKKDRLTAEQLRTFELYPLPQGRKSLAYARDCFMLQFYLHGARVGDVLELTHAGILPDRVDYVMRKTGKLKSVKRSAPLNAILDRYPQTKGNPYVLPFLDKDDAALPLKLYLKKIESKTAFINRLLKEVAAMAEINLKITTHVARHTFADIARKKVGDMHTLKNMLAHSSIKTTEIYVSELDQEAMDNAGDIIYG